MPVNSSSIPALITAGKVRRRRRKRRASGGGVDDAYDPMTGVRIGAEDGRTEEEALPNRFTRGAIQTVAGLPKALLWDLPHESIEAAKGTSYGLRREDYTDVPPDYSPDQSKAIYDWGLRLPKGGWQPTDALIGKSLESGLNVMGGTALSSPAKAAGEVAVGAGPIRATRAARAKAAATDVDGILAEEARLSRAAEQGYEGDWYHGGARMDRFTENGKINPKRATSGPMPFFTGDPAIASKYATGKIDTSMPLDSMTADYFTVAPKDLGFAGRSPVTVEQSWHYLPSETKADILAKSRRVGHADVDHAEGALTLHPEGVDATGASAAHFEELLRRERGNPLAALRDLWSDSGRLFDEPGKLAEVYRLAGYPHPISEAGAPWTEARGVFPAMLRMRNPLDTGDAQRMTEDVLPALEQAFKRDRSRAREYGTDQWDKNRTTPREWVRQAKEDYAKGDNSFVWTQIPDKVTAELKRLGFDGILDTGGKMGGQGHRVAIPFEPDQVRSRFAAFNPKNAGSGKLLGSGAADKRAAGIAAVDDILDAERRLAGATNEQAANISAAERAAPAADPAAVGPGGGGAAGARSLDEAAGGAVNAALGLARKIKRAKGGKVHIGPIVGDTGGRADKVPMSVPDGSYVIPADIVSGIGEGNTGAGMVKLGKMFPKSKPRIMRETPGAVPILAADGEFVVSPESILDRWDDLSYGHQALDAWVLHERQQLIETLEGLEPPAQD